MSRIDTVDGLAAVATLLIATAVCGVAIKYGTFVAADTDPYAYVSQADLISAGTLHVDQSFARTLPWIDPELAFTPPGYTLGADKRFIVPVHPTGLPLLMSLLQRLTGTRHAAYYVVPLLGALTIFMTARLGTLLDRPATGVAAALLVATSPVFLFQVPQPVSDVPAAAWWTTAAALACGVTLSSAIAAGAATSLAIATRPNLVLFAVCIGAYLLWRARRAEPDLRRAAVMRAAWFAIAAIPGCIFVAAINDALHGSPLRSGYGPLEQYFRWEHVGPNLDRYPRWLMETQTPFIVLAVLAPWLAPRPRTDLVHARRRFDRPATWMLLAFIMGLSVMTVFYGYFGRDEWVYLRLLLPALPAALILSVMVLQAGANRLAAARSVRIALVAGVIAVVAGWQVKEAVQRGAFITHLVERRYLDVGRHLASATPGTAAFVTGIHAGSIRYYSGRLTMYFPNLYRRALDLSLDTLRDAGYYPYIVLEAGEEEPFKRRFGGYSALAALDWPPRYQTTTGTIVRVWDPADRDRVRAGETIVTVPIAPYVPE
jgi:hypothetical protein